MNLRLSGRLLARKALLNFIGQAVPLLVGVVTIPFTVQGLGTERFGLLVFEVHPIFWTKIRFINATSSQTQQE